MGKVKYMTMGKVKYGKVKMKNVKQAKARIYFMKNLKYLRF